MKSQSIELDKLLLDPNNYRFAESSGYAAIPETRFSEDSVQRKAFERLRDNEGIIELKKSIAKNGFLPIEPVVVRKYGDEPERYLVIEGNRRTAAAKWLIQDSLGGIEFPQDKLDSITNLPCVVLEPDEDDEVLRASLMGIRHVSGIRQWGGYQRATLVAKMRDNLNLEVGDISDRLGMTAHEVNRRYKAIKALNQMEEDEEYGDYATPALYPVFHEAVSLPVVRDWLGWDSTTNTFSHLDNLSSFYSLLAPSIDEDSGQESDPKISTYSNVRDLRVVLGNFEAREVLLQPGTSLNSALLVVQQKQLSTSWLRQIEEAVSALESLSVETVRNLTEIQKSALLNLQALVKQRISDNDALNK
jgi:hypothetical protein